MGRGGRQQGGGSAMRGESSTRDTLLERQRALESASFALQKAKEKYRSDSEPIRIRLGELQDQNGERVALARQINSAARMGTTLDNPEEAERQLAKYDKETEEIQEKLDNLQEPIRRASPALMKSYQKLAQSRASWAGVEVRHRRHAQGPRGGAPRLSRLCRRPPG